ncbi:hypothetical protein HYH03_010556 [Edaphochlamys debaryana]|uniref:Uncharacterized protein n=1 Tax=Edaphochlamys debaryana TaxID=47281 RepID=A0A836BWL7_9CHLO|nr:hypothetical protein HYH03_010556 [Edaphochlamys debaryana]|eukprot:KAG2491112.1 hypothetical protein HYH03_010556 [Edaphochlamys debaryana]
MDGDDAPRGSSESASSSPKASGSPPPPGATPGTNPFASPTGGASTRTRTRSPPPPMASAGMGAGAEDGQRQKSMDLVNEGLEGLFPRAKVLLQLGGSIFLAFVPFMLVISALFSGLYFMFGDSFVHGGRVGSAPTYIDPEKLLSEQTVDQFVPFETSPYAAPELRSQRDL